ncbi:MAG: hypothetical protein HQM10_08205 [Candidatus Riflebacteria bacterium]|nr:hypothetical protein [Candidatus Riflebacteria bacterium]
MLNKRIIRIFAFFILLGIISINLSGCSGTDTLQQVIGGIGDTLKSLGTGIWNGLTGLGKLLIGGLDAIWGGVKSGFSWISGFFSQASQPAQNNPDTGSGVVGTNPYNTPAVNTTSVSNPGTTSNTIPDSPRTDLNPNSEELAGYPPEGNNVNQ